MKEVSTRRRPLSRDVMDWRKSAPGRRYASAKALSWEPGQPVAGAK